MELKRKVLIITDSPALPTGMAETTRLLFGSLLKAHPGQYELHQLGLFHCYAVTAPAWPVYPTKTARRRDGELDFAPDDRFGERTLSEVVQKIRPDLVFAFNDPIHVLHVCLPPDQRSYKLVLYINFDGFPFLAGVGSVLRQADRIFTNSHFAAEVAKTCCPEILPEKVGYMYSPADTSRFCSLPEGERAALRGDLLPEWMPPNAFVLGWVGRNQWRKQIWALYKALHYLRTGKYLVCQECDKVSPIDWDPVRQSHLDRDGTVVESRPGYRYDTCIYCNSSKVQPAEPMRDVFLWLHTPPDDPVAEWPLRALEYQYGLQRDKDVYYTEGCGLKKALAPEDMPMLYQVWDALLYLSGGEGFGLPAWEAMCCGLPVVYTDYSSHAEFLGLANAGLPVDGILQPEAGSCIFRMIADVPQAIEAVRKLYLDRQLGRTLGANGRAFVQQFTPEIQAKKWHRILQEVLGTR